MFGGSVGLFLYLVLLFYCVKKYYLSRRYQNPIFIGMENQAVDLVMENPSAGLNEIEL